MRPHSRRSRWPAATAVGALVLPLVLAAPSASASVPGSAATTRPVLLIDGTTLRVGTLPGGGRTVAVQPGTRPASLLTLRVGRRLQVFSADMLPYLGRGLDPSLFDLSALRRAESHGTMPVRVIFTGTAPRLPGITVTQSGQGSEQGYLTAAGAAAFGAALFRQFRADHARASYGQDGLFAGGVDIALAGATAAVRQAGPRPARPRQAGSRFRLHTLTMAATDLSGHADTGDVVFVLNTDNPARFDDFNASFNVFFHGTAKFSVPAGHYWAIGDFISFTGTGVAERLVVLPQFSVFRSPTVRLSERSASSEIGFTIPRPATLQLSGFTIVRGAGNGSTFTFGFFASGLSQWVSPTTRKPTVGTLRTSTSGQLTSSRDGANAAYAFNLDYAGPDGTIPARQHFDATPNTLAAVTNRYVQDVRSTAGWGVFGGFLAGMQSILIAEIFPFSLPRTQVQYYVANPSLAWSAFYFELNSFNAFGGGQNDAFRVFSGGQRLAVDWNAYPLHPQPDFQPLTGALGAAVPALPSAFRTGDTLSLFPNPFSDNSPGHLGFGAFGPGIKLAGKYTIYQNGLVIGHGNPFRGRGIVPVRLSAAPSVIRFVLSAGRFGAAFPLSTAATTIWTWRSALQPGATVPPNWLCGFSTGGKLSHSCAVQPMMTLDYHVRGLPLDGRTAAGPQLIELQVGHIQLAKSARITRATAQVSYNDGQTFQPATVTSAGGGRFRITFTAPAGVDVTLRVSADDAAGGSITETILRAFGVA